jgi:hypothetical protein
MARPYDERRQIDSETDRSIVAAIHLLKSAPDRPPPLTGASAHRTDRP